MVNKVAVPLSYAEELYALRNNIYAVRKRVLARMPRPADQLRGGEIDGPAAQPGSSHSASSQKG